MDPRSGERARAGQLAASGRQRRRRSTGLRPPEPRDPGQLRARVDLQGHHGVGRDRGGAGQARDPALACRPSSRWPTARSARPTTAAAEPSASADILARSSNVGSVMIGLKLGAKPFDKLGAPLRLRQPTGVDLPGEAGRHRAAARELLGLLDRQHADRPGHRGHADADGRRLHGDRQPRGDAAPLRRSPANAPPAKRVLSKRTAAEVSKMLEGVLAAGGTAEEASVEGYTLAGKTGTAEKADQGRLLEDRLRSLVHRLRTGHEPAAAGGGHGRRRRAATTTAARSRRPPSSGSWSSRCPT